MASKNVTLGVPRLKELLGACARVSTPYTTVRARREGEDAVRELAQQLRETRVGDLMESYEIHYDPTPQCTTLRADEEWLAPYVDLARLEGELSRWGSYVLRCEFSSARMRERTHSTWFSFSRMVERVRALFPRALVMYCERADANSVVHVRVSGASTRAVVRRLRTYERRIHELVLFGVSGVVECEVREARPNSCDYVVVAHGRGIASALSAREDVDARSVASNDVREICELYGVEAAREALVREFKSIISFDTTYVNVRHIMLLCDAMTQRGALTPVSRAGVDALGRDPLAKASFEMALPHLAEAALHRVEDPLLSVSSSIVAGNLVRAGTGVCSLLLDEQVLQDNVLYEQPRVSPVELEESAFSMPACPATPSHVSFECDEYVPAPTALPLCPASPLRCQVSRYAERRRALIAMC